MMRLELSFARPLLPEQRIRLLLALGALAKARRVRVMRGDQTVEILGEDLGSAAVRKALDEAGIAFQELTSSLDAEADAACEDCDGEPERVRAIGR